MTICGVQAGGVGAGLLAALFAVRLAEVQAKRGRWDAAAAELAAAAPRPAARAAGHASTVALVACEAERVAGDAARWQGRPAAALEHYEAAERAAAAALAGPTRASGPTRGLGCASAQAPRDDAKAARRAPRGTRRRGDCTAAIPSPADGDSGEPGGGGGRLAWALRVARARDMLGRAKCAAAAGEPSLAAELAAGALACLAPPPTGSPKAAAACRGSGSGSGPRDAALRDAPVAAAAILLFQAALLQGGAEGPCRDSVCYTTAASRGSVAQGSGSDSEGNASPCSSPCAEGAGGGSAACVRLWGCMPAGGAQQPGSSAAAAASIRACGRSAAKAPVATQGEKLRRGAAQTSDADETGDAAAAPGAPARLCLLLLALAAGGGVPLLAKCELGPHLDSLCQGHAEPGMSAT